MVPYPYLHFDQILKLGPYCTTELSGMNIETWTFSWSFIDPLKSMFVASSSKKSNLVGSGTLIKSLIID